MYKDVINDDLPEQFWRVPNHMINSDNNKEVREPGEIN